MRLPIQAALFYPGPVPAPPEGASPAGVSPAAAFGRLDFSGRLALSFEPPDTGRFPLLRLAYEALRSGGLAPVVYNAANEAAVAEFLAGKVAFTGIAGLVEDALSRPWPGAEDDLDAILETTSRAAAAVSEKAGKGGRCT